MDGLKCVKQDFESGQYLIDVWLVASGAAGVQVKCDWWKEFCRSHLQQRSEPAEIYEWIYEGDPGGENCNNPGEM